jgi:multiple sugar transport system permease protein
MKYSTLNSNKKLATLFHGPTLLILLLITLGPLLYTIWISLFSFKLSDPGGEHRFIGLKNYVRIFQSPEVFGSIWTTFKFMLLGVGLQAALGLAIAIAIHALPKYARFITTLILVPMMIAPLVVGLIYSFFLNPQFGLYAYLVNTLHLPLPISLLGEPNMALLVVILTDVWQWTPYLALMFFAGLQSIPGDSFEAGQIDGANSWQTFRYITFPMMKPIIVIGLILRAMEAFKEFDKPYILTGGGPGSATEVIDMYAYKQAFVMFDFSYAAAICVVLFLILSLCGLAYGKFVLEGGLK